MSTQSAGVNPFAVAQQWMANQYEKGLREYHHAYERQALEDALAMHKAHNDALTVHKQEKPTPENTGAPVPKRDQRTIPTPENTGAPMPGQLAKNTAIHPITGQRVPKTPVKPRGKKPTAPGTKPKKK